MFGTGFGQCDFFRDFFNFSRFFNYFRDFVSKLRKRYSGVPKGAKDDQKAAKINCANKSSTIRRTAVLREPCHAQFQEEHVHLMMRENAVERSKPPQKMGKHPGGDVKLL